MTKVRIEPGICGFTAIAEAEAAEDFMVHLRVVSGCAAVQEMMKTLGSTFSAFDVCLTKPGTGPFYAYAAEHFGVNGGIAQQYLFYYIRGLDEQAGRLSHKLHKIG